MEGQSLAIEIAIIAVQARQVSKVKALKDFLVSLPNPKQIEQVLITAVIHCVESDPELYRWIVNHARCFEPELDFCQWSRQTVLSRLLNQGCSLERDFRFESLDCLWLTPMANQKLLNCCSQGENLLLRSFLRFRF